MLSCTILNAFPSRLALYFCTPAVLRPRFLPSRLVSSPPSADPQTPAEQGFQGVAATDFSVTIPCHIPLFLTESDGFLHSNRELPIKRIV